MSERRLGVVLVHGFRSGAAMWDGLGHFISEDEDLDFVQTLPFAYPTTLWNFHPLRKIPTLGLVADGLKTHIDTEGEAFPRLMIVAHSQGGLIVQRYLARMLAEGRGRDLARIGRVVLLACPNEGSQIFMPLRRTFLGRWHPQERQLRTLSEEVKETQQIVLPDIVYASAVTDRTCPIPFDVYAGMKDGVVTQVSAQSVFRGASALPGDHFTIARLPSTYSTLKRLILATADSDPPDAPAAIPSVPVEHYRDDALALDVHPVIETSAPGAGLPPQPPYVTREHDEFLRDALRTACEGRSRLVVLVGGSSTGKTRACFEALLSLDPEWRLWRPPSAEDLVEVLSSVPRMQRTVLWLNETQRYLTTSRDDPAARALQALLDDPARGPVAIMSTLWPEHHQTLTRDADSPAAQLLKDRQIVIADVGFQGASKAELERVAQSDPRLAEALTASRDEVTQYLAGGRELLNRYEGAVLETRALIDVAVDAARLGCTEDVSEAFLKAAAWPLVPESHKRTRDQGWREEWFERALADAGAPCRGVPGPLTTLSAETDEPHTYRLADYLRQKISARRALGCPPDAWWEAAVRHVTAPADLLALARAAQFRARYRISADLAQRSMDLDPSLQGRGLLVDVHFAAGHVSEAEAAAQQALAQGDDRPALRLARLLQDAGEGAAALDWRRRAAEQVGGENAWARYSASLLEAGKVDEAILAGQNVDTGRLDHVAYALREEGHADRVLPVARQLAAKGDGGLLVEEASRLYEQGRLQDAIDLLEEARPTRAPGLYETLMNYYEELGDTARAEEAGQQSAERGYGKALKRLSVQREEAGDLRGSARALLALGSCPEWEWWLLAAAMEFAEAEDYQAAAAAVDRAIAAGRHEGWVVAAYLAETTGDLDARDDALQRAALTDDAQAWSWLGTFHEEHGNTVEAETAFRRALGLGDNGAWFDLASMWHDTGDPVRRDRVVAEALAEGQARSLRRLPDHVDGSGDRAAAEALALRVAEHGEDSAGFFLARKWRRNGRAEEALGLALALQRMGHDEAIGATLRQLWEAGDTAAVVRVVEAQEVRRPGATPRNLDYALAAYAATGATEKFTRTLEAAHRPAELARAGRLCRQQGHEAQAVALYERAHSLGDRGVLLDLAQLHHQDRKQAERLLREAVDAGVDSAPKELADHYARAGNSTAADRVRRYGLADDGPAAPW
ncbi:hypothetical protein [Streptomyces sp. NL15-2K]|uniref:hypothetical protein n=1 Tax=Streptomyces sp. NL15-2K TaxID=376149 RepID=UPI000F573F9A|nr:MULTISPECIES: hypothetical protein [Actinomycetes]WKX13012.1 hypothetical protein Q4V64_38015 [Kutzneria buriramensis]